MLNSLYPLSGLGLADTRSADALDFAVPLVSDVRVRLIKRVSPLAMRFRGVRFELHIRRVMQVLGMGNKLQVVRPDAARSNARVMDLEPIWDLAHCQRVGQSVGEHGSFTTRVRTSTAEVSISTRQLPAYPQPASFRPFYLRPKALLQRSANLLRTKIHQRITVAAKPLKVHSAQTTALNGLQTIKDHALHVSTLPHCAVRGSR